MPRNSIITRRGNCAVKPRWISTLPVRGKLSINRAAMLRINGRSGSMLRLDIAPVTSLRMRV